MERHDRLRKQIAGEAAEWFALLQDSAASASERDEFARWLLLSPAHIEEYLAIARIWGDAHGSTDLPIDELVRQAHAEKERDNVVALLEAAGPALVARPVPVYEPRSSIRYATAAAASVAIAVIGWLAADRWIDPSSIHTAVGEQRSVTLQDGSILHVNTDSEVRVDFDGRERRVVLAHGEARFSVAKDAARAFLVTTPHATVRAVGTVFNVRAAPDRTAVTVIEGRVALTSRAAGAVAPMGNGQATQARAVPEGIERLELDAGEQAAVTRQGSILPHVGPSVESALAWSERRLVFRDELLGEVVAEFNRYHERSIRIDDPALAAIRISGSFYAGDPQSLVQFLERYERVRIIEDSGGDQILMR